jgi:hypothetical protein
MLGFADWRPMLSLHSLELFGGFFRLANANAAGPRWRLEQRRPPVSTELARDVIAPFAPPSPLFDLRSHQAQADRAVANFR